MGIGPYGERGADQEERSSFPSAVACLDEGPRGVVSVLDVPVQDLFGVEGLVKGWHVPILSSTAFPVLEGDLLPVRYGTRERSPMAKVHFTTRRGRSVAFDTHPSRPRKLGPFARYVRDHIGKHLKKHDAPIAMKKLAVEYRKKKKC